jgi:predicted ATPase/DNA-binding SARP family transcriptional activator
VGCQVLGVLSVNGTVIGSPAQRRLLASLVAARGQIISNERLVDALWDDAPPPSALNALQSYVSRLRASLGRDAIIWRGRGYRLDLPTDAVDAWRFESLISDARARTSSEALPVYEEALGLWHGPPFAELAEAPMYIAEVRRLGELHAEAQQGRLQALFRFGYHDVVVTDSARLVEIDPYREAIWELRMRALHAKGRTVEAIRAYHDYRMLLAEAVGLEPSAELSALERVLAAGPPPERPEAPALAPARLPLPLTTTLGRENACAELVKLLLEERLVTLVGPGGVGKSRLSVVAVHAHRDLTALPSWYVELEGIDRHDVAGVVCRAVGVGDDPNPVEAMCRMLGPNAGLLVLDNCEHVAGAVAGIANAVLPSCPSLRLLATSRTRLGVPGERTFRVGPLPLPDVEATSTIGGLLERAGTRLFIERAASVEVSIEDRVEAVHAVVDICHAVDGLPLGIELAASMAAELPLARIADALLLGRSAAVSDTRTGRHASLTSAVAWSYELLGPDARRLARWLSVFEGGWTVEAAETVAEGSDVTPGEVAGLLAALTRASFITLDQPRQRYGMLSTIRAFALTKLDEAGETRTARDAHLRWCRAVAAEAAGRDLTRHAQPDLVDALERDHANLRSALRWALSDASRWTEATALTCDLLDFWEMIDSSRVAVGSITDVLALAVATPRQLIELRLGLARHLTSLGDFAASAASYQTALTSAEDYAEPDLLCRCLMGVAGAEVGDAAVLLAQRARAAAELTADLDLLAETLHVLGFVAWKAGRCVEAVEWFEEAGAIGVTATASGTAFYLGLAHAAQGHWSAARGALQASERNAADRGDRLSAARSCLELARLSLATNDTEDARRSLERAAAWSGRPPDHFPAERLLFDALAVAVSTGDDTRADARIMALRLAEIPTNASPRGTICEAWLVLGMVLLRLGESATARQAFCNVLRHRGGTWPFHRADALDGVALTLAATRNPEPAAVLAAAAEDLRSRHGLTASPSVVQGLAPLREGGPTGIVHDDEAVALALRYEFS